MNIKKLVYRLFSLLYQSIYSTKCQIFDSFVTPSTKKNPGDVSNLVIFTTRKTVHFRTIRTKMLKKIVFYLFLSPPFFNFSLLSLSPPLHLCHSLFLFSSSFSRSFTSIFFFSFFLRLFFFIFPFFFFLSLSLRLFVSFFFFWSFSLSFFFFLCLNRCRGVWPHR